MRVLVVEDDLHPHGGQERCLLECTEELAARGHEIDLFYRASGESFAEYNRFCRNVHHIPGHLLDGRAPVRSVVRWIRSTRIAARGSHDIVYINQHQDSPFGAAVAILKRIPLVCHLHLPPPVGRGIQWRLARPTIARYIAVSHHTRTQYLARGVAPTRIEVVHNGIDLERYQELDSPQCAAFRRALGIPLGAFVVLYAGRLDPGKGVEVLIDAFNRLGLTPDKGRLLIAGGPRLHRDAGSMYEPTSRWSTPWTGSSVS
jgi:glycosyltransferase involved in cell wall biosynthesis